MSLTRGSIGVFALVVLIAAIAEPMDAPVFIVLSLLLALLVVNIPYALLSTRNISVVREHPSHVKEGTEVNIFLHVCNSGRSSKALLRFYDDSLAGRRMAPVQVSALAAGTRSTVSYICSADRRGVYRLRTCRVESSAPFGLVNTRRELSSESEIVVYPIYYELMGAMFPFLKTFSGITAAPGARPGEGPTFFGLREYRHGDPIRKIHWPSTIRARAVMVKEFEEDMHSSVTIFLDSYRESIRGSATGSNLETAIRVTATMANYTLTNGHPTTFETFDEETQAMRHDNAVGGLTPVLDALARLKPSSVATASLIERSSLGHGRIPNGVVVLLQADRDSLADLLRIRAGGTELLIIIVDPAGPAVIDKEKDWLPEMLDMLEAAGVNVILMAPDDDVQATLSRRLKGPRRVRRG